ncbi:MAG: nicotinate-nucleotide--dimethylbenzimidazole phosphoribosyltransferase, partial [Alphaproteobacteria bacterium]
YPPEADRARVCVFAGSHGVAARGVSAYPAEAATRMVGAFVEGGGAINQICRSVNAELRIYEMDLDTPTADIAAGPAMSEADCVRAMAYGMMAVEPGLQLLCLGDIGIGNTTAAAAMCLALYGGAAADWTGPGSGVAGAALDRKRLIVEEAVAANPAATEDPLEALRRLGGQELAAIAGAVIAARMARIPVLLDGFACTAAAAAVARARPGALDHCLAAHRGEAPGHGRLLDALGMTPLLDLGIGIGEGAGAALAVPLLRAALACHTNMTTGAEAGLEPLVKAR